MATAYFMQLMIEMTDAKTDQQHIEMIVYNAPSTPDRTSYILGESQENPVIPMIEIGNKLAGEGVDYIAIPCITAHYFHEELQQKIPVPIIHGIFETVNYLAQRGYKRVGVMATDGTVQSGLFTEQLNQKDMDCVYPSAKCQQFVMDIIYRNVKAGIPIDMDKFREVSEELFANGAQVILLGCTELSMAKRDEHIGPGFLDVMEVLAKAAVERCGTLKKEYEELITK